MAPRKPKVTSSINRSTRRATKPITSSGRSAGKNPKVDNRVQRSRASTAKVTTSGGGTKGSARVTTGRGSVADTRSADAKRWKQLNSTRGALADKAAERRPARPAPGNGNPVGRAVKIGETSRARAADLQGRIDKANALSRQRLSQANARRASARMTQRLRQARTARTVGAGARLGAQAAVVGEVFRARPTADGTLTAAKKRGDLAKRRKPSPQESAAYRSQEAKARAKNASRRTSSFDDAFASARRAKAKTFTWRGKKYTTEMK